MEIDFDELTPDFPYELSFDMKYIETIGKGAFGTVLHVLDLSSNKDIAVKVIKKNKTKYEHIDRMKKEISILRILNHPNIVKFYGYIETNNQLLIKMEYIKYGSLKKWIKRKEKISEEEASTIIGKILSAIEYLHTKQICHRDIKPENIMLSKENDLSSIKIIDFGLSQQNFDNLINNDYCGTYIYMAPELIEKKLYFNSIDIWSIGILMFILLNKGKHPFYIKGDNRDKIAKKIEEAKINFNEKISPMAKHLILKLLEPNPSWRYTASQAIKHPWITRNINDTPPTTFNELLVQTNNKKILKDLFITCLFMNFFSKKEEFKYKINKKYKQNCDYFSQVNKIKLIKRKEKCLDVSDLNNEFEIKESPCLEKCEEKKLYERKKTKENPYSFFLRNSENFIKINIKQKLSFDKKENKNEKSNDKTKIVNLLKKYQSNKINRNNLKSKNQNTASVNAPKLKIKKNIIHISKIETIKKSNSTKNLEIFETNKNNPIYTSLKNKEEIRIEKKNEQSPKRQNSNLNKLERLQKNFDYLSSQKLRNHFPKLENIKRDNLFKKNNHVSLNRIENYNCIPLVLPNLGKIRKIKEKKNSYMKLL